MKHLKNSGIPIKILKANNDSFAEFSLKDVSSSIACSTFPSCLKLADKTHLHKKRSKDKMRELQTCKHFTNSI